jgi:hypothetical protein
MLVLWSWISLVFFFYHGRFLFLLQLQRIVFLDSKLDWQLFSFRTWDILFLFSFLLALLLKNLLLFWCVCLIVDLLLLSYRLQYSLFCTFSVLTIICPGVTSFWACLFGAPKASCTWTTLSFLRLEKSSVTILLNVLSML